MAPPTLPNASPLLNQRQRTIALVGTPPEAHVKGNPVMAEIVDWHQPQPRRRRLFIFMRSEEHTSELQSLTNLVCRLLLEKKKKKQTTRSPLPCTQQTTSLLSVPRAVQ